MISPDRLLDIHGKEVTYKFDELYGKRNPRTLWQEYSEVVSEVRNIAHRGKQTLPAYSATCKNCVWYTACVDQLTKVNDLTLIPGLGRSKRDVLVSSFSTISELAEANPAAFVVGKKTILNGIGPDTLQTLCDRARLIANGGGPYLRAPVSLPVADKELFFDIEVDPMRDLCYLHGFVERNNGDNNSEKFVAFFADEETPESEEKSLEPGFKDI